MVLTIPRWAEFCNNSICGCVKCKDDRNIKIVADSARNNYLFIKTWQFYFLCYPNLKHLFDLMDKLRKALSGQEDQDDEERGFVSQVS